MPRSTLCWILRTFGYCAKFCFNVKVFRHLTFSPMLWRPKTNCEISPLLQSIKKYPACKSSCNSVICNDLHLFLSSIVFCGSSVRHEPWPHSTNLHPASLFYGHFWIQKWSLRSTRYRYMIWLLLGGTFWLLWQGKNARFALHPLFTSGTKRNSTSLYEQKVFLLRGLHSQV